MHLKRIKAFDELAKSSTILPYGVRPASGLPVTRITTGRHQFLLKASSGLPSGPQ